MSSVDVSDNGTGYLSPLGELLNEFAVAGLPHNSHSIALAASQRVLSGAGYLVSFTVSNTNAAAQFIQFHDSQTAPGSGAIPSVVYTVAGSSDKIATFVLPGRYFERGIWVVNSSTSATLTAGSADCWFDVQFLPILN